MLSPLCYSQASSNPSILPSPMYTWKPGDKQIQILKTPGLSLKNLSFPLGLGLQVLGRELAALISLANE